MTDLPERHITLDVIRGFAVMGILIMNIAAFGLPNYAYLDPSFYGGDTGADLWAWALAYAVADGKMRMLFTLLFGASLALTTDRAENPAFAHFARMAVLLGFGMIHAWLIWYGDILVEYALVGAALFWVCRWPPAALLMLAAALVLLKSGLVLSGLQADVALRAAAAAPDATATVRAAWAVRASALTPDTAAIPAEIAGFRGGLADVFAARAPITILFQTVFVPFGVIETTGLAAVGLALYRLGFLTGDWSTRAYRLLILAGLLALLLYPPLIRAIVAARWASLTLSAADQASLALRPFVALGYAAALILWVRSGRAAWLRDRFAAAGRMAFSNYLGTSLVATTVFYGYGLGLFGQLSRAQLYWVVLLIWVLILAWSQPWLTRFRYGPFEWLWRSLARGAPQPMRR